MYRLSGKSAGSQYWRQEQPITSHHLGQSQPGAKQIYASQAKVKELTDANFWNIFYDRDKVIVVSFWADWCRPCDGVAGVMASLADRYSKGQFARLVKLYHVQWDPRVNPRVHQRYGFNSIPVIFFYYTSTGRQPTKTAPLLEGSMGGDKGQYDPQKYIHRVEDILRRHGKMATTRTVSETVGWKTSRELVSKDDFGYVDQILVEPSPFQRYFLDLYRANPTARFSKGAQVLTRSSFDLQYQRINGPLPGPEVAGTVDKPNGGVYLLSFNNWLQVYLGSAVHEAVHFFSCPMRGPRTSFHSLYGHGVTEGFTQYVTEEMLKSQKVRIVDPPYPDERAVAAKLIEVVGLQSVADDYFRCTRRVFEQLNRMKAFGEFARLRTEADQQSSDDARKEAWRRLRRFLEGIQRSRTSL